MDNIFNEYKLIFAEVLGDLSEEEFERFTVEPCKDSKHGDFACNAAMVFLRKFDDVKNPRELADRLIAGVLAKKDSSDNFYWQNIARLELAGPGFINIFVENAVFSKAVADLLSDGVRFPDLGKGQKVNLEYASPNPTGPIHVGHTRGAIYGDVLAELLKKTGFDVLKEYYINDAGAQIEVLLKSAHIRYLQSLGLDVEIGEGLYPGEYLIAIGDKLHQKYGDSLRDLQDFDEIRDFVVNEMVYLIVEDLAALGIRHDNLFSEKRELHDTGKIEEAIGILREKGLIYEGKLEIPKTAKGVGALPEGYSAQDQTLFASTKFGDDVDRVVKKADGTPTYLAGDMAYVKSKFARGAVKMIMPLGFDHAGYVKRLTAVVKALTDDMAQLKVILCQMVKFVKDGKPLKMSKRAGNFITARQVIDEVGADALRFIMLTRKNDAPFDFDLTKVVEQSKDNPIFYVQYCHARCCSVLRNAALEGLDVENDDFSGLGRLNDVAELEIIKKIIAFSRMIEMAAKSFEAHRIAFYLQELAALFHSFWNKGVENPELKFIIKDDLALTQARICLVKAVRLIIATGLDIFNIKALEEMR